METTGSDKINVDMEFENTVAKSKAFDLIYEALANSGFDVSDLTHVDTARLLLSLTFDNIDNYMKTCLASATKSFVDIVRVHAEVRSCVQDACQASESIKENARTLSSFPAALTSLSQRIQVLEDMFLLKKDENSVGSGAMLSSSKPGKPSKHVLMLNMLGGRLDGKRGVTT